MCFICHIMIVISFIVLYPYVGQGRTIGVWAYLSFPFPSNQFWFIIVIIRSLSTYVYISFQKLKKYWSFESMTHDSINYTTRVTLRGANLYVVTLVPTIFGSVFRISNLPINSLVFHCEIYIFTKVSHPLLHIYKRTLHLFACTTFFFNF